MFNTFHIPQKGVLVPTDIVGQTNRVVSFSLDQWQELQVSMSKSIPCVDEEHKEEHMHLI